MIIGITMQQPASDGPHLHRPATGAALSGGAGPEEVTKEYGGAAGGGAAGAHFDASQIPAHHMVLTPGAGGGADHHLLQQHHYSMMNGGAVALPPPQQVYVTTTAGNSSGNNNIMINNSPPDQIVGLVRPGGATMDMSGLESQFQSLGLRQEEGTTSSTDPSSEPNGDVDEEDDENERDGDEEDDDGEEPVKLFVGQVPKQMNEEDIFPTFDSFGPLKDVTIIRDKHSGMHRGCAFVTYWSPNDAMVAQEALHNKFTFPGGRRPVQVKPAEPSVAPEHKLFIGMLSRKAGEAEVRELFSPFGEIKEIYMIRSSDGISKCAAFLRFAMRESAMQAIDSLNGNYCMEGSNRPLIVRFADNKHQRQLRQMRTNRRQEMIAAIGGPSGYPSYPQLPPHMALPHHGHPAAVASPYQMPGPQYGSAPYVPAPGQHPAHHPYMYPSPYGPTPPYGYPAAPHGRPEIRTQSATARPREGPSGANLFIYHLPHDLTDADLATAFNPFGNVISAKVYVDKYTGESKGFGFVSYDSVHSADQAIEQMNGFQIGSKRLKVQHKRVHGQGTPPEKSSPSPPPLAQVPPPPSDL